MRMTMKPIKLDQKGYPELEWYPFPQNEKEIYDIGLWMVFIATDEEKWVLVEGLFDCGEVYWPKRLPKNFKPKWWIPKPTSNEGN